jgi:hypothetical protein
MSISVAIQSPYCIYAGTSTYKQALYENLTNKGIEIFLYGVPQSGNGGVASTLNFVDGYGNYYPIYTIGATSAQSAMLSIYPGLLGTSSVGFYTQNGILPKKYYINSVVSGTLSYQLSVNELP